jgi:hypothetical protein
MSHAMTRRLILAAGAAGAGIAGTRSSGASVLADVVPATAGLFTQLAAQDAPAGTTTLVTTGHGVPGLGSARYRLDTTSADPAAIVRRFPRTAVLIPGNRLFRLDPHGPLSVFAVGAIGDGIADDAPAIQEFLDSLGTVASWGTNIPVTLDFHAGRFRLGAPLRITQNLVRLHADGATLDGKGQATGLIRVDHDASVNSPTSIGITGQWFLQGAAGDAITLRSAPLFVIGRIHATGITGDVVNVQGSVGGTTEMIEAYDCGGFAYREGAMNKRYAGDGGGHRINCINNRIEAVRAFRCAGAWMGSESWHASVGRIDVESSKGSGVVVESCLAPSFDSIYEEDHAIAITVRTAPRVFGDDFPVGGALFDTLYTAGARLPDGSRPCSITIVHGPGTIIRAGRVCGDIRLAAGAGDVRIDRDVDLLGQLVDAGKGARVDYRARRIVTVVAGARSADVAFDRAEPDDRYTAVVQAIGWTGTPEPGALIAKGADLTRGGFRLQLLQPVPPGCTVTFLAEAR